MGVIRRDSKSPGGRCRGPLRGTLAGLLATFAWLVCHAQEQAPVVDLPQARHLAAALSDPESRDDALLTLLAAVRLRDLARARPDAVAPDLAARFREDRARLGRLADRYPGLPMRSPVLDPSAWFLLQEFDQYQRVPARTASPLGPPPDDLLTPLFDSADQRLASTLLPAAVSRIEVQATERWLDLIDAARRDPALAAALTGLAEDWFDPWMAAEPPPPEPLFDPQSAVAHGVEVLQRMTAMAVQAGPPDALLLKRLRFGLHRALPALEGDAARDAGFLLVLAATVDGLHAGEPLAFTESLLWIASGLLLEAQRAKDLAASVPPIPAEAWPPVPGPAEAALAIPGAGASPDQAVDAAPASYVSPLPRALSELLPPLSSAFSPEFSRVDPRINTALATVFDVAQYFNTDPADPDRLRRLLSETADIVARWVLLVPDMSYYFDQPVRRVLGGVIADCVGGVVAAGDGGPAPGAVEACLERLREAAGGAISSAELAGDPDGPFGVEQLQRELILAPWQRVNYVLGYLQSELVTTCRLPDEPLPNPLEWSNLVSVLDGIARSAPYRFRTDAARDLLRALRSRGVDMLAALARETDCISGAGTGIADPVSRGLAEYRTALDQLVATLREAELAFRAERLEPGADVVLRGGAEQATAYRPEDRAIGPCDERTVCEMRDALESSPALLARFPDTYLLADQLRMGEAEICYDNVRWVDRRAEPVRADDPNVANYHGRLAFDLVGRYREGEDVREVFGYAWVSPEEHHYLFGAATPEVLEDECPVEWIGTRITTGLGGDTRFRVVPDRLTYLTAARSLPSRLLAANWNRGQQWRAAFETGVGVRRLEYPGDPGLADRLDERLQALHREEQAVLYGALFTQPERGWRLRNDSLYDRLAELNARKSLLVAYVNLLYPQSMIDTGEIRGLLVGRGALLDERILRQFRREGIPVAEIGGSGRDRLERMLGEWNRLPGVVRRGGSVAVGVAHSLVRLDALERDLFERLLPGEYAPLSFDDLDG